MKLLAALVVLALNQLTSAIGTIKAYPYNKKPNHIFELHASDGKFWKDKPTKAKCPEGPQKNLFCPETVRTTFTDVPCCYGARSNMSLYSFYDIYPYEGNNRQQVYIANDYSMSYTNNGEKVPNNSITHAFQLGMLDDLYAGNAKEDLAPYICRKSTGFHQVYWLDDNNSIPKGCVSYNFYQISDYGAYQYE